MLDKLPQVSCLLQLINLTLKTQHYEFRLLAPDF